MTAVAAMVAAIASVYSAASHWRLRNRELYVSRLSEHLESLSAATHEVMCIAYTTSRKIQSGRFKEAKELVRENEKAQGAIRSLEELKARTRYILPEFDIAFQQLIRINSYLTHCAKDGDRAKQLVEYGNDLRASLDAVVIASMKSGEPPRQELVRNLTANAQKLKDYFENSGNK
ncbi:protein of unknown function [Pseudodesulfovibrio profundus]|uniref:Uncharacterized protein n=1 Tax=Pseudodesulfovibrio profundus TaxID=57320 RepID=A0A2C8F6C4_9BACT|nr:protein of unknown function [Pseudodesulfovibrio profundus]